MPIPPLPYELLDSIFDYVEQIVIFRCMLVCRAWYYQYFLARLYRHPVIYRSRSILEILTYRGNRNIDIAKLEIYFAISDEILLKILEYYGNTLISLLLHDCHLLTRDALGSHFCPNLRIVGLKNSNSLGMRRTALIEFIERYPALEHLDISHCNLVVSDTIMQSLRSLRSLRVLNLSENKRVTDKGLQDITDAMPELEELRLAGLENVTEEGIIAFVCSCPRIRRLDLARTKVSEKVLEVLAELRALREINVSSCDGVTPEMVARLLPGVSQRLRD